jgi:hypothetical protein
VIAVGEPIKTPRVLGQPEMQQMQAEMAAKLKALFAQAKSELDRLG